MQVSDGMRAAMWGLGVGTVGGAGLSTYVTMNARDRQRHEQDVHAVHGHLSPQERNALPEPNRTILKGPPASDAQVRAVGLAVTALGAGALVLGGGMAGFTNGMNMAGSRSGTFYAVAGVGLLAGGVGAWIADRA